MTSIQSLKQFRELQSAAHAQGLKQSNFLMPESELVAHIGAGAVRYGERDNCVCAVIRFNNADWLYYWLNDIEAVYMPDFANDPVFSFFGFERMDNPWPEAAALLGLPFNTKILRFTAKVKDMVFPEQPPQFVFSETNECGLEYYLNLTNSHFNPLTDMEPTYMWQDYLKRFRLIEARDEHGTIAGFYVIHLIGKTCIGEKMAVMPAFRGHGLALTLFKLACNGLAEFRDWVHESNMSSIRIHAKTNMTYCGQYRKVYGIPRC
jgi:hypothetical protein